MTNNQAEALNNASKTPTRRIESAHSPSCCGVQRHALPRTKLFGIAPQKRESLTSYIAYLAEQHTVSPRQLVSLAIKPLLPRGNFSSPIFYDCCLISSIHTANGLGKMASAFVEALEVLTGSDLTLCTLLPLQGIISTKGLLRSSRAWCPKCLADGVGPDRPYEQLLWVLAPVSVCRKHRTALCTNCPHCHRTLRLLSAATENGYCDYCQGWLGVGRDEDDRTNEYDYFTACLADDLLTLSSKRTIKRRGSVAPAVNHYVAALFAGNRTQAARLIGVSPATLFAWGAGSALPSLEQVSRLCYLFELRLEDFLDRRLAQAKPIKDTFGALRKKRHMFQLEGIEEQLSKALTVSEALCLRDVAQRIGTPEHRLKYHYPALCDAISRRYAKERKRRTQETQSLLRAKVQEIVAKIHATGAYPGQNLVARQLPPGSFRGKLVHRAWKEALEHLGYRSVTEQGDIDAHVSSGSLRGVDNAA